LSCETPRWLRGSSSPDQSRVVVAFFKSKPTAGKPAVGLGP
jgi:hypothetical protein